MEQQTLPGFCERVNRHSDGETKVATHILRRNCPHCGYHQVLNICQACHDYITMRNNDAINGVRIRQWRCMSCGKTRDMPQGMDILGTV